MQTNVAKQDPGNKRRAERIEVFLRTGISFGRKANISAQLVNISSMGFMARSVETFSEGDRLRIMIPYAGDVAARVAWSLGGRIGCAFEVAFNEREFAKVLGAIKTAKPNWQTR